MAETKKVEFDLSKYRVLAMPFIAAILIVASFTIVVWPKTEQIINILGTIKAKREKENKLALKLSSLKGLNETELVQRSKMLVEVLPETKEAVLMISVIKQAVTESGLELKKISVTPGKVATGSAEKKTERGSVPFLEFSVDFNGSPEQIKKFSQTILNVKPVFVMEDLSFKEISDNYYSVMTKVSVHYYAFPTTLGRIDAPLKTISAEENKILERVKSYRFPLPGSIYQQPTFKSGKINPFL